MIHSTRFRSCRHWQRSSGEKGQFFDDGHSFPSGHAIESWSLASIIAHEYGHGHTKLVPILAYGLAGVVISARFAAQQHYAPDIISGAAMGWFIGRYVYQTHMDHSIHHRSWLRHHYYLLGQSSWTDAEAEAITLGGHLVTINDAAENTFVFKTFDMFGGIERFLWIGFTDDPAYGTTEGNFVWSSGEPVTYTNWNAGEPNNNSHNPEGDENFTFITPRSKGNPTALGTMSTAHSYPAPAGPVWGYPSV